MQKTLKRLTLRNFTSYEDAEIEFSEDVTVIRGNNGHGKSNIMLALQIILFADDFPDTLIRWGQKEAYIQVDFTDGSSISRTRTGKAQKTILTDNAGVETVLTNIKTSSEIIQNFTGFMPVKLDENSSAELLQYLTIDDSHFLLNKSAEVTLRMLSALISGQGIETAKLGLSKQSKIVQTDIATKVAAHGVASANIAALTSADVQRHKERAEELLNTRVSAYQNKAELLETYKEAQDVLSTALSKEEREEVTAAIEAFEALQRRNQALTERRELLSDLRNAKDVHAQAVAKTIALKREIRTLEEEAATIQTTIDSLYQKCKTCGKITLCEDCNG